MCDGGSGHPYGCSRIFPVSMNSSSIMQSTLSSDVEIAGTITFKGDLQFDSQLSDGDLVGENLVVGPHANVRGNIQVTSLILHGAVTGDVFVTGRCELKGSANLVGSLTTSRLVMEEGATLIGDAEITPNPKTRPTPPKPASKEFLIGNASLRAQKP